MTREESVKIFRELWRRLAESGSSDKSKTLHDMGFDPMLNDCPLCDFIYVNTTGGLKCNVCPIDWSNIENTTCGIPCSKSYYRKWYLTTSVAEKKKIAGIIANLPENPGAILYFEAAALYFEEVITKLRENPTKIFRSTMNTAGSVLPELIAKNVNGGIVIIGSDGLKYFTIPLNRIWQLAQVQVTWQEAIQALFDGKTIRCEKCQGCIDADSMCVYSANQVFKLKKDAHPCWNQLKTGTWYVLN